MITSTSWISKKLDRCGGNACIRDTRITVWGLVSHHRLGLSDAEILEATEGLTPADLQAAWEYAKANAEEIDQAIRENEEGEEGFVVPPLAYLRAMLTVVWEAFRHPLSTSRIDLTTGRVVERF